MTLTCSHGGVKVKMKYTLQIYIVPSVRLVSAMENLVE